MAMKKGLGKGLDSMIPEKKTKAELKDAADKTCIYVMQHSACTTEGGNKKNVTRN